MCDWWPGTDYSADAGESTFKACWDYWGTRGVRTFGQTCTVNLGAIYSSQCSSGLCFDFDGAGTKCGQFCNLDTDCQAGYRCDFFFTYGDTGLIRACQPE